MIRTSGNKNIGRLKILGDLLGVKRGILGLKEGKICFKYRELVIGVIYWILGHMISEITQSLTLLTVRLVEGIKFPNI